MDGEKGRKYLRLRGYPQDRPLDGPSQAALPWDQRASEWFAEDFAWWATEGRQKPVLTGGGRRGKNCWPTSTGCFRGPGCKCSAFFITGLPDSNKTFKEWSEGLMESENNTGSY
ncbi:hypothetical protein J2Z49_001985 [Desulfofundulus luciae]|uniref:Uncharacterized protein n=1 Tax=Desulfofundulus luciae TaxID=74702 RepID=A0ABU0B5Y8_9FIRM|nr:hypothetical protein [Desulfofundulus luciae]